jgi:hypothetical protein
VSKGEKIKALQKKLKTLQRELIDNEQITKDMQSHNSTLRTKISRIKSSLDQMVPKELRLTDHAILRYMQRAQNIDVDGVREEIEKMFENTYISNGNIRGFVIRNNTIVTYVGEEDGT